MTKNTPYQDTNQPEIVAPQANTTPDFSEIKAQMTAQINKVTLILTRLERDFLTSLVDYHGRIKPEAAEMIVVKREALQRLIEDMEHTIKCAR